MGFASDSGYTPATIETIMLSIMANINTQFGTSYTYETFVGSNFYKYFYALAQEYQKNEIKTSEIFLHLQDYFALTNEAISRPVITAPGIVSKLLSEGYTASVKPPIDADAGKLYVCVDVDDGVHAEGTVLITSYANLVSGTDDVVTINGTAFTAQTGAATLGTGTFQAATSNTATAASLALQINNHATAGALVHATSLGALVTIKAISGGTGGNAITLGYTDNDSNVGATKSGTTLTGGAIRAEYAAEKLDIATIIMESSAAGVVTQGSQVSTIVLTNGQAFDFKFNLPNRIQVLLRLTIETSDNNRVVIGSPDDTKNTLITNILSRYNLGLDFEPQKYFGIVDAPWAATVLLEYSTDNGGSYSGGVYQANYDDLFDIKLENVTLVEI